MHLSIQYLETEKKKDITKRKAVLAVSGFAKVYVCTRINKVFRAWNSLNLPVLQSKAPSDEIFVSCVLSSSMHRSPRQMPFSGRFPSRPKTGSRAGFSPGQNFNSGLPHEIVKQSRKHARIEHWPNRKRSVNKRETKWNRVQNPESKFYDGLMWRIMCISVSNWYEGLLQWHNYMKRMCAPLCYDWFPSSSAKPVVFVLKKQNKN